VAFPLDIDKFSIYINQKLEIHAQKRYPHKL